MPQDLNKILDEYSAGALTLMAQYQNVLPKEKRTKGRLIGLLLPKISSAEGVANQVASLTKAQRALLDAILRRDGQASVRNLRAEMSRLKLIDPNARVSFSEYSLMERPDPQAKDTRRFEDLLANLMMRGLVYNSAALNPNPYQNKLTLYDMVHTVFIPDVIKPYFPTPAPLPGAEHKPPVINTVQESSARVFQRELYLYWSYIRDHTPSLTQKDEITKQALKDLNGILLVRDEIKVGKTEADYPRVRFLRAMLEALKLASANRDQTIHTVSGEFFQLGPADRVKETFTVWQGTNLYNELLLLPEQFRPRGTASNPLIPARGPLLHARKYVVQQIHQMKPTQWVELQSLVERIYERDYEFLFKRSALPSYYSYSYSYGVANPYEYNNNELFLNFPGIVREEDGWQKVEANLIRGIVTGPLYWMGLVDLGWTGKEEGLPDAFRLTALGAWVFGMGPQPEIPMEGGRVIVQPTMQIMALDPIQDAVLATLDRFAERLSAERAVEYRLTRASVYAAQQVGMDAAQIKAVLEQYSGAELPGNVARTLDEWQAQYERITIRPRMVVMHGDPQVLDQVGGIAEGSVQFTARPLPELAFLENAQSIGKVTKFLRSRDVLPVVNRGAAVPPNSITCTETGEVRLTTRLSSLYLHGHLATFADPVDHGYQITPASVQRAVRSGLSAPEIIERLGAVHAGPLPEKLARSIRAWAKHYGSAALAPVTLLQVRDAATLEELLSDPEIGPLLKRFDPKPRALARVEQKNLEKLRALLLLERGIDLKENLQ